MKTTQEIAEAAAACERIYLTPLAEVVVHEYLPVLVTRIETLTLKLDEARALLGKKDIEREAILREAQQAVVLACVVCDGQGWTLVDGTESAHGCDGTEADCARTCPVPVPVQIQEACEYCGRPVAAIQSLLARTEARNE